MNNPANPTQLFQTDRVENIVNNDIKQAIALEITKRKMDYMANKHPNSDLNADTWVDEFHTALSKIIEAEKDYARNKTKNRYSEF